MHDPWKVGLVTFALTFFSLNGTPLTFSRRNVVNNGLTAAKAATTSLPPRPLKPSAAWAGLLARAPAARVAMPVHSVDSPK